jgi:hypothetical protein
MAVAVLKLFAILLVVDEVDRNGRPVKFSFMQPDGDAARDASLPFIALVVDGVVAARMRLNIYLTCSVNFL